MGCPKQMLPLKGKPILGRSIEAFMKLSCVKQIIVVCGDEAISKLSKKYKNVVFAKSGDTRVESVINGLKKLSPQARLVAVHDGARPLVNPENIKKCLAAAARFKAAILAVPVKDTIKVVKNGKIINTPDRSLLYAAQTPQCYIAGVLKNALKKYSKFKNATDESQLVEKTGVKVRVTRSDYRNIKITTPEDLIMAEALCG